jgi:uncharacterized iron-regulated membrane protein
LELVPLIVVALGGGVVYFFRELIWLKHCRYLHDQAVARGQDPDPEKLIEAARGGTLRRLAEHLPLPRKLDEK